MLEGMASPFPFSSIDCFIGCFLSFFLFPVVGCFIGKDVFILLHEKDGKFWLFGCSGVLSCEFLSFFGAFVWRNMLSLLSFSSSYMLFYGLICIGGDVVVHYRRLVCEGVFYLVVSEHLFKGGL